jgi:hypothetical protein
MHAPRLRLADRRRPGEADASLSDDQQVAAKPRPTAVPVGKRMYEDGAVTEAHGNFIRRAGLVVYRTPGLIDRSPHPGLDEAGRNADVALCPAMLSRPAPDVGEHPATEIEQEPVVQDLAPLPEGPPVSLQQHSSVRSRSVRAFTICGLE